MSAMPADVIERVEGWERTAGEDATRRLRVKHMVGMLVVRLRELEQTMAQMPPDSPIEGHPTLDAWHAYVNDFDHTRKLSWKRDFDEIERFVKRGYHLILFEQDTQDIDIAGALPKSKKEYDALPDALDELARRRRAI
jgi:hypothetical protein